MSKEYKKYQFKRENRYRGIKVANYEREKNFLSMYEARGKKEIDSLINGIEKEKALLDDLEKERSNALLSGDQNAFLDITEQIKQHDSFLEFYLKRKDYLEKCSRIQKKEVLELSKSLRNEQDRLNRDALKWLYEELEGVVSVLAEVDRELKEGDSIFYKAIELYMNESVQEAREEFPGRYSDNTIETLLNDLSMEQDSIKKIIDEI